MPDTTLLVSDVMSSPPVVVRTHDSLWRAMDRFLATGLRHLVVLDESDVVIGVLDDPPLSDAVEGESDADDGESDADDGSDTERAEDAVRFALPFGFVLNLAGVRRLRGPLRRRGRLDHDLRTDRRSGIDR